MAEEKKILIVGSLNMDLVVRTAHLPTPGETVRGFEFNTYPGGKGANQAVAAGRLADSGSIVYMIGRVGEDDFGTSLLKSLNGAGVNAEQVKRVPGPTGNAMITVEESGENVIIITAGANGTLTAADMEGIAPLLADADVLLLQLEVPLEAVERAAALAAAGGATVILNPAPAPDEPLPLSLLQHVSILVPNETEAAAMTGEDDPVKAVAQLRTWGIPNVVLTLGAQGALVVQESGTERVDPFPITPVDTTAAGDSFVGALAVALVEGQPLRQAARFAAAAGALAATKPGAQPSLPQRQALLDFMNS